MVSSPKEADGSSNLLSGSIERYLIIPSSSSKSFVISLSEDAIIDKFMLLNAEEFSCTIELFNLYGSDTFDPKNQKWEKLGSFLANNDYNGSWQSFKVKETWIRYLKFEWKTSYGTHKYCTLTQIKVCGRTMVQGLTENLKDIQLDKETPQEKVEVPPVISVDNSTVDSNTTTSHSYADTETIINDILRINEQISVSANDKQEFMDVCGKPSIDMHLMKVCPIMMHVPTKEPTKPTIESNPSKLNEVFVKLFKNLELKIKQLTVRVSYLYDTNDALEWRVSNLEKANQQLRIDIDRFKMKFDKQEFDIKNLTYICYCICILLIILIICLCL